MGGQSERRRRRQALLATLMAAASLAAQAASDGGTMAVTAKVVGRTGCLFVNAGSPTLDFGTIDQASTANATAATTITVRCRGNMVANWRITADNGLNPSGTGTRRMRHQTDASQLMPYALTISPASGRFWLFWGAGTTTVNLTGSITPANFQPVAAGPYSDSVTLTLTF